jgi:hypothetical protein
MSSGVADGWHTFPAQMGAHRAFITFNEGYARLADEDPNDILLKVRVEIKAPTDSGLPTNDEFPALAALDERLEETFASNAGAYVGRLTVDGQRYFYFYVTCSEDFASQAIGRIAEETSYHLTYIYEEDQAKDGYWKELYPTDDDWQMIKDLRVLDTLREQGDDEHANREVSHWAYFPERQAAEQFADWLTAGGYRVRTVEPRSSQTEVRFTHVGTMRLEDITHHTITLGRKASELNGDYDGWETSVEAKTPP